MLYCDQALGNQPALTFYAFKFKKMNLSREILLFCIIAFMDYHELLLYLVHLDLNLRSELVKPSFTHLNILNF